MEKLNEEIALATGRPARGWHVKARLEKPPEYPDRFPVPDEKVLWETVFPDYEPPYYVSPVVLKNDATINPAGWADPEDVTAATLPAESFGGPLRFDESARPLNPIGRTGIAGRGLLGKWGPNYAADPIITRINHQTGQIEMLAVQRRDNGQWAIPGGMVDKGEEVSKTLARELQEETGMELDMGEGHFIYQGYVDDPRNTDHAWMETTAKHLHLAPEIAARMTLQAGSDAKAVRWLPLLPENVHKLYASHCALVKTTLTGMQLRGFAGLSEEEKGRAELLLQALG
jgi:ADP-ribose pyrophosphatase